MKSSGKSSVKFNFIMNCILTMSSFVFPLITFPYVSRVLLPEGMGKVSFALSVVVYFAMLGQLGIPLYGIRACANVRDDKVSLTKTAQEIFIINITMSLIAYTLFFAALCLVPRLHEEKLMFYVVSMTIIFSAIGFEWLYKAVEQYKYIAIRSIGFKIVALVAMFALIHKQSDYIIYAGISVLAAVGSNICNFINVRKHISLTPVGGYNFRKHYKAIGIFFAMTIATTIYTNLDMVMLGFMKNNTEVGYYSAAVKIKMILVSIITSLGAVLLPRASYYINNGFHDEFMRISKKAINFVFVVSTALILFSIIFARDGIVLLSGNAYLKATLPMQILMPTLLLIGLTNIMGIQMLVPLGREKVVLYSVMAGAVTCLSLNLVLIPSLASTGAAIGVLIAEVVVFIVQFCALKDFAWVVFKDLKYIHIFIGLALALFPAVLVKNLAMHGFAKMVMSSFVFFFIYILYLILMKEPLALELYSGVHKKYKGLKATLGRGSIGGVG